MRLCVRNTTAALFGERPFVEMKVLALQTLSQPNFQLANRRRLHPIAGAPLPSDHSNQQTARRFPTKCSSKFPLWNTW